MEQLRRKALDLVKANENGTARISAARLVMLADEFQLQVIIHAYCIGKGDE